MAEIKSDEPTAGELKIFDIIVKHGEPITAYAISQKLDPPPKTNDERDARHTATIIFAKKLETKGYLKSEKITNGRVKVLYSLTAKGVALAIKHIEASIWPSGNFDKTAHQNGPLAIKHIEASIWPSGNFDKTAHQNGLNTLLKLLPTIKSLKEFQSPLLNYLYDHYPATILEYFMGGQAGFELTLDLSRYMSEFFFNPQLLLLNPQVESDEKDEWALRAVIHLNPSLESLMSPERYDRSFCAEGSKGIKRMEASLRDHDKSINEILSVRWLTRPYEEYKKEWEENRLMVHNFLADNKAITDRLLSKMSKESEEQNKITQYRICRLRTISETLKD